MTANELKPGDVITFAGVGYTKRGNLITNGRYWHSGRKAKAKIVKLKRFTIGGETYDILRGQTISRYNSSDLILNISKPA